MLLTRQSYRNRKQVGGHQGLGGGARGLEESGCGCKGSRRGPCEGRFCVGVTAWPLGDAQGRRCRRSLDSLLQLHAKSPLLFCHPVVSDSLRPTGRSRPEFAQVHVHCIGDAAQPSHLHCLQVKSLKKWTPVNRCMVLCRNGLSQALCCLLGDRQPSVISWSRVTLQLWCVLSGEVGELTECVGRGQGSQPRWMGAEAAFVTAHDFAAVTAPFPASVSSSVKWG